MSVRPSASGSESDTAATEALGAPGTADEMARRPRIGRYVALGPLGQGAMGHVLRAYDPKLRREVALKLVFTRASDAARAQVVREAQAMAQLSHPNIVAVYDAEVVDEQPFLVMEYVEGTTLREWTRERPRPWREVLDAYLQAGRGLAAAHAAGLVHRDFKPANVMRRPDGRVQVMDFGIAHMSDDVELPSLEPGRSGSASRTATGMVIGTPAYMAPEQHAGRPADARSDQYAFCVALWEGLAGERPFSGDDLAEAKRELRIASPASSRALPRHLEKALVRGLSPDPAGRHASVEALLVALSADPTRRRRAVTMLGVAVLASGAWAGWAWRDQRARVDGCRTAGAEIAKVWNDDARARAAAAFNASGVAGADATLATAVEWIDRYTISWSEARIAACLRIEVERRPAATDEASIACYEERRDAVESLAELFASADAHVVRRSVRAAMRLPRLGACVDEVWLRTRPKPPDDPGVRSELADVRAHRSRVSRLLGRGAVEAATVEAETVLMRARELNWPPELAEALLDVAELREAQADYAGARTAAQEAFTVSIAAGHDAGALAAAARLVYVVGYGQSDHDTALQWSATGTALAERLGLGADHPGSTALLNNTAVVHWARGDYEEARALHERVIAIKRSELGPGHLDLVTSLANVAIVHMTLGEASEAEHALREALRISREALGDEHISLASLYAKLGSIATNRRSFDEALRYQRRALEITERSLGPDHFDAATILNNLGWTELQRGRPDAAAPHLRRALEILSRPEHADHPVTATTVANLGRVHSAEGRHAEALALYERALQIQLEGAELPQDHPDVAGTREAIAYARAALGGSAPAESPGR